MNMQTLGICLVVSALFLTITVPSPSSEIPDRMGSVFLSPQLIQRARKNALKSPYATAMRDELVAAAKPWLAYTDEQLWEMMFGNTIKRSWMVWSNGYCPACRKGVPMYTWVMDPHQHRWKVRCPHCREQFPKNDFERFYRSGLDSHHVFDPQRADRSLLYNKEHPDPKDPLYTFGVDDGEGYVAEGNRWRFIGAYLIYGQWKQLVQGGILRLAAAYAVTGDAQYAHRAGVLLDRVADLYPSHDFGKQGVMYEGAPRSGYVSTWHDACIETRQMAFAYDMVREALRKDAALATFLAEKAKRYSLPAQKTTPAEVLQNIENGILRDPQKNLDRIYCNYPQTEMTVAILKSVLNEPQGREQARAILGEVIEKSASVDGITGEKGLTGYAVFATANIATVLATYGRTDPTFLKELLHKHPRLAEMFRFHIDVWCGQRYYPRIGDCGSFAQPDLNYAAINFTKHPGVEPSMYAFLWQLYEITRDPAFVQVLYHANGDKTEGLPYDMFATNPVQFQERVAKVISRHGSLPKARSTNKQEWHLAILKGGTDTHQRALWLDYDSGGYHSHADGLNIGLFAYGLDLLPDFGYPPVQFGGWGAPRAVWYTMTAAHNTVVVDGKNQRSHASSVKKREGYEGQPAGKTTLWADGKTVRAVRAEAPNLYELAQYERMVAMADVSEEEFYVFDLFRIRGGTDHARMTYSSFGSVTATGLTLQAAPDYGHKTQLRHFRTDLAPSHGWNVDWKIEDRLHLLPAGTDIHLRLNDLTEDTEASLAEGWINANGYNSDDGEWIPCVMTRRRTDKGTLASDFVSVIQPYKTRPFLTSVRRIASPKGSVIAEIGLVDGRQDLWLATNPNEKQTALSVGWNLKFTGDLAFLRRNAEGNLQDIAVYRGQSLAVGTWEFIFAPGVGFVELHLEKEEVFLRSGAREALLHVLKNGKTVRLRTQK